MDVHHIKYYLAVCETLNFTQAAARCHVSQPALSRAIQQLETELGGLLFRRDHGQVQATELGRLLRPQFDKIYQGIEMTKSDAQRFLRLDALRLRLGVMCTIGPARFTGILARFNAEHSEVAVQITEGMPDALIGKLNNGEIEMALMAQVKGFSTDFWWRELYRERFVLAFSPSHRFAATDKIPFADLNGENYLRRINCEYDGHLSRICGEKGITLKEGFESEREDWIQNLVAGGFGICFLPEFSAFVPGVTTRPITEPGVVRSVCVVRNAASQPSAAARHFVDSLSEFQYIQSHFAS